MILRPIKRLVVNGIEINNKTDWKQLLEKDEAAWYAHDLFINSAYPAYLKRQVEKRYGTQIFIIEKSNHLKYKKHYLEHPEWF